MANWKSEACNYSLYRSSGTVVSSNNEMPSLRDSHSTVELSRVKFLRCLKRARARELYFDIISVSAFVDIISEESPKS